MLLHIETGHYEVTEPRQLHSILEIDGARWSEDTMPRTERPARFRWNDYREIGRKFETYLLRQRRSPYGI